MNEDKNINESQVEVQHIKPADRTKTLLSVLVVILTIVASILSVYIYISRNNTDVNDTATNTSTSTTGPYVNVGLLQFDIVDGKGTKRTDAAFINMKAFLDRESANSRCGVSGSAGPGYVSVVASTTDQKQLLLAYGCVQAGAKMYAVNINNEWKTISPTNEFNNFEIPGCYYLDHNNISPEIGPVCANGYDTTTGLITGSPKYLNR